MRLAKLALALLALALALIFGGCGQELTAHVSEKQQQSLPPASSPVVPSEPLATDTPAPQRAANPVRLLIPSIGVNALIENVGVTSNGDLAVPEQHPWDDVGWYASGPRPGERGSAVIDGHLDRTGGGPAVFWYLRNMHVGDAVMVIDASGKTSTFHVREIGFYPPLDAPIQQIFGNDTSNYLNLITCAGDWIPSQHQTNLRLVVYTTLN